MVGCGLPSLSFVVVSALAGCRHHSSSSSSSMSRTIVRRQPCTHDNTGGEVRSVTTSLACHDADHGAETLGRRSFFAASLASAASVWSTGSAVAVADDDGGTGIVTLRFESKERRLGLELSQVVINGKTVVAIKGVSATNASLRAVRPGMIVLDYDTAGQLVERVKNGPYPVVLRLRDLAAGGDAFGDGGRPLVTPEDALRAAVDPRNVAPPDNNNNNNYVVRKTGGGGGCNLASRRGDVLEINYEARYAASSIDASPRRVVTYDSSRQRGTGRPYVMVLGSGDMIPGVDNGLYDMCPGDTRELDMPSSLGYGNRGSRLYRIPSGMRLLWTVELVSVNGVGVGDPRTRDEMEGRYAYE